MFAFIVALTIQPFPPQSGKKSEIIYGVENAVGRGIFFMSNVKNKIIELRL